MKWESDLKWREAMFGKSRSQEYQKIKKKYQDEWKEKIFERDNHKCIANIIRKYYIGFVIAL
ncbi:MAG: hypothetical protein ACFFDN_11540 [Candidatus Hodarchaeota archaeon]